MPLTALAKRSILDVWQGSEYASAFIKIIWKVLKGARCCWGHKDDLKLDKGPVPHIETCH